MHSLILVLASLTVVTANARVGGLTAEGHDSRIDLIWEPNGASAYNIYRSASAEGPFKKINKSAHCVHIYSDFFGRNEQTYYYRVTSVSGEGIESPPSETVGATSRAMTDGELLTSVQKAVFRYFWDYAHPVSKLARERTGSGQTVTTGGSGFGLMTIMVGAERGFVSRQDAAARVLGMVAFLQDKAQRYHGAWSHHLNGTTGATIAFAGPTDDGGDLVETSFLVQGLLTVRQYFNRSNQTEEEIRQRVCQLWREVEWDWYLRYPAGKRLYWHWSPNHGWEKNLPIGGRFNECMITYLLAIASPTHPIPPACYYEGWTGNPPRGYVNGNTYYGDHAWVGKPLEEPLFFTHYSFLGFDPRAKRDKFCNYYENNRNFTLINRAYCAHNPRHHQGYSELLWGLTASDGPRGYRVHTPQDDSGTITPTAAISAMPYAPEESLATLKHLYHVYGDRLWGEFGFRDAFNLDHNWFAPTYLAIDQGTIVPMIENHRTGLCWKMFMSNPEIVPMLVNIGWQTD